MCVAVSTIPPAGNHRCGFTLVELSIVLVIVALLIGAVLGGQEMIQASRLQAVVKDTTDIRDAFQTFKEKYGNWPGDMPDATDYWSGCVNATDNPCNGDGDGQMWGVASQFVSERFRAWQHLALSGIVPGNYTGLITDPVRPGENVYPTPFEGFYFMPGWNTTFNNNNNFISMFSVTPNAYPMNAAEAKSIDQKVDDGIAFRGRVFGVNGTNSTSLGCPFAEAGVGGNAPPQDYNVSRTQKECLMRFNWLDSTVDQ